MSTTATQVLATTIILSVSTPAHFQFMLHTVGTGLILKQKRYYVTALLKPFSGGGYTTYDGSGRTAICVVQIHRPAHLKTLSFPVYKLYLNKMNFNNLQ